MAHHVYKFRYALANLPIKFLHLPIKFYIIIIQNTYLRVKGNFRATYKLVGVIRFHTYGGGTNHYTAFVRSVHDPTQWFHADDSQVSTIYSCICYELRMHAIGIIC